MSGCAHRFVGVRTCEHCGLTEHHVLYERMHKLIWDLTKAKEHLTKARKQRDEARVNAALARIELQRMGDGMGKDGNK